MPAAVVSQLARSIGAAAPCVPSAAFAAGVTQMIGTAASRPIAVAAAAILCLGASGAAWVAPARVWSHVRVKLDVAGWLHRLFDLHSPLPLRADVDRAWSETERRAIATDRSESVADRWRILPPSPQALFALPKVSQTFAAGAGTSPADHFNSERAVPAAAVMGSARSNEVERARPTVVSPRVANVAAVASAPSPTPPQPAAVASLEVGNREQPLRVGVGERHTFDTLTLGKAAGDVGTVVQTGGEVIASAVIVGDGGVGSYDLSGGRLAARSLTIAAQPRSRGRVTVGGGELHVTNDDSEVRVGAEGSGRLLLGTQDVPGRLTTASGADVSLVVRATASAQGLVQGWGDVQARGTLVNNGRVVADGFNHLRALSFAQASGVINAIDNASSGTNGWYVRRGGRIELPTIAALPGTHTYTWGESADDARLDLVNSLRLTAHDQPMAATLDIALRTIALSDPIDVPLPTDAAIFGLWQFESAAFDPRLLDVQVRYDHVSTSSVLGGEFSLRLIGHDGVDWQLASDAQLDVRNHIIGGTFAGGVDYLAVAMFWNDPFGSSFVAAQSMRSEFAMAMSLDNAIVPEPSGLLVLAVASMPRRRRRR